jgi:hypothetical protein
MEIHLDWRTPFMIYLRTGGLPEDKVECERLRRQAGQYTLVNDEMYWRGTNDTLMKCTSHLARHSRRSLRKSHWCKVTRG